MNQEQENEHHLALRSLRWISILLVVAGTTGYWVPGMERFQPWVEGDPIPFSGLLDVKWSFRSGKVREALLPKARGKAGTSESAVVAERGDLAGSLEELEIPTLRVDEQASTPEKTVEQEERPAPAEDPASEEPVPVAPRVCAIQDAEWEGGTAWIEDPSGSALRHFYDQLDRLVEGESVQVRVAHYGDSTIAADDVTQTLRRNLQKRFGDSGHGYLLPARGDLPYGHRDVYRKSLSWKITTITSGIRKDGMFGYGGMIARGTRGPPFRSVRSKRGRLVLQRRP